MKYLLSIILFCFSTTVFSLEPDKLLYEKAIYPTILIEAFNSSGTGFIVKSEKHGEKYRNVFVTCAHVVPFSFPFHTIKVPVYENHELAGCIHYNCYMYATDDNVDLAVGVFESKNPMPVAELKFDQKYYIGTKISKIGCGLCDEPRVEYGHITSPKTMFPAAFGNIRFSSFTIPGDSGGPLLIDNRVVGVVSAIRNDELGKIYQIGYASPIEDIKKITKSLNIDVEFVYESKASVPSIPFTLLKIRNISEVKK